MGSIYDHDNSEYFEQNKSNDIYNVMERYNIPRPVKKNNSANAQILAYLASAYQQTKELDNEYVLHLDYSAKGDRAYTPLAYYVLHSKARNFTPNQLAHVVKLLPAHLLQRAVEEFLKKDSVITTLSSSQQEALSASLDDNVALTKTLEALPVLVRREVLSCLADNVKGQLVDRLLQEYDKDINFLTRKQKDNVLAQLFSEKNGGLAAHYLTAMQKYSPESRDYNVKQFPKAQQQKVVRKILEGQFATVEPKLLMLFSNGTERELNEYTKLIEVSTDKGLDAVPQTEASQKFFESLVALNVDTKTGLVALMPGMQSEAVLAMPAVPAHNKPRLIALEGGSYTELGDVDNRIISREKEGGGYQADISFKDVYDAMHELSHALKLRHRDEMFYDPVSLQKIKEIEKRPIKGFIELPSKQPSAVQVERTQQHVVARAA